MLSPFFTYFNDGNVLNVRSSLSVCCFLNVHLYVLISVTILKTLFILPYSYHYPIPHPYQMTKCTPPVPFWVMITVYVHLWTFYLPSPGTSLDIFLKSFSFRLCFGSSPVLLNEIHLIRSTVSLSAMRGLFDESGVLLSEWGDTRTSSTPL